MRTTDQKMRSTAIAALLSLPVMAGAAFAQQSTEETQSSEAQSSETQSQDTGQQQSAAGAPEQDALVATVGDAEIRGSDVMAFIDMLPPHLQSQPPQMLVPMALEQLIVRELVLETAQDQNFAEDPEVKALVDSSAGVTEEDAMVKVWIDRETEGAVTDEAVQEAYEKAQSDSTEELPPIEEVRPQIERFLRQQAMQGIQIRLRDSADIVLYDSTGQPVQQKDATPQGQGTEKGNAGASGDQSGGTSDNSSGPSGKETEGG